MKTVLFACIHNAGRSQMAAAWFNALADEKGFVVAYPQGVDRRWNDGRAAAEP